jgi:hypothetical protein
LSLFLKVTSKGKYKEKENHLKSSFPELGRFYFLGHLAVNGLNAVFLTSTCTEILTPKAKGGDGAFGR